MKAKQVVAIVVIAGVSTALVALLVEALREQREREARRIPDPIAPGWDSV